MKNKIYILISIAASLFSSCSESFLERDPLDTEVSSSYWTSEQNIRTYSYGFYTNYFEGYGSGFSWPKYTFLVQSLNDDCGPITPTSYTKVVPATGGGWSYTYVRKANDFITNIPKAKLSDEATKHWIGVARFFRALEYGYLVNRFGDVPWIGQVPLESDSVLLYRNRDPRTLVMDSVLADFQYAAQNVRASDGKAGLTVNKYVVLSFMSRIFLFEGTFLKYHNIDQAKATAYLEASKWAANEVINSGLYSVVDDYRGMFNSLDLAGNKEIILFRSYVTGVITHSINSYTNKEVQTGVNKNVVESYLCSDGLPISLSPNYAGDQSVTSVFTKRDPRIYATLAQDFRLDGNYGTPNHPGPYSYSTTGYANLKFLNEVIQSTTEGGSSLNPTDGPVIRYGEVLLNYAEACAELGSIVQADLDKSINKLRKRIIAHPQGSSTKFPVLPDLQVIGGLPGVGGVTYDDPKRDPSVPALIWEIRRERRIELLMEGFRWDDLRRWKKLEYTDTKVNSDINRGVWITKTDYPGLKAVIEGGAPQGYIIPSTAIASQRQFISPANPRVYLYPLPLDQITLYKSHGVELKQNPGWE